MKNVTISSSDSFVTPVDVQNAIRNKFSLQKFKEVSVKYDSEEKSYDVYDADTDKFICSFSINGEEI